MNETIPYTQEEVSDMCADRLAHERTQKELNYDEIFAKHREAAIDDLRGYSTGRLRQALAGFIWHALPQHGVQGRSFEEILETLGRNAAIAAETRRRRA